MEIERKKYRSKKGGYLSRMRSGKLGKYIRKPTYNSYRGT